MHTAPSEFWFVIDANTGQSRRFGIGREQLQQCLESVKDALGIGGSDINSFVGFNPKRITSGFGVVEILFYANESYFFDIGRFIIILNVIDEEIGLILSETVDEFDVRS